MRQKIVQKFAIKVWDDRTSVVLTIFFRPKTEQKRLVLCITNDSLRVN